MIHTTIPSVPGKEVVQTYGVVTGEVILGANVFKDIFASVRDFFGGRSGAYEKELMRARTMAFAQMDDEASALGADAIIGIDIDYETIGAKGSMLMVSVSGTAIKVR